MANESRLAALMHWMIAGAPGPNNFTELTSEIGRRLESADLPVDQFGIYKTMMHPELPGRLDYWTSAAGARSVMLTPKELREGENWIGTPPQVCQSSGRMLDYRFGDAPEFDHRSDMQSMLNRGYVQIVCLPLHSQYTPEINTVSFATKLKGGFAADDMAALRKLQAPMARVAEAYVLHESTIGVLSTYVGRNAGQRVLTGNILRGDTEVIPSIVLFVDLKGFTALSNEIPPEQVIKLLNLFFTVVDNSVRRHGGEILKFLGDGALAIFPTPDDHAAQIAATDGALSALEDIRIAIKSEKDGTSIEFRAALHLGDVHYGNIGSTNRLDFTVVGPTVNLASRLLSAAAELGEDIVCSSDVVELLQISSRSLGKHEIKGFPNPISIHAID
jgi:adenylate cyclase